MLTTNDTKQLMCTMTNSMLREGRLHVLPRLYSRDSAGARLRLREQMGVYSYQFKAAATTFQKDRACLSGKVGEMKVCRLRLGWRMHARRALTRAAPVQDDICICLHIGVRYTAPGASAAP